MVNNKTFNELTNKEVWEIAMLRSSVFTLEQKIEEEELKNSDYNAIHYFIKEDDAIVSYARLIEIDEKCFIGRVCTKKEYRKLGKQKAIIKEIIKTTRNTRKLYVSSQVQVVDFYLKFGFRKIGTPYVEAKIDHQLLVLNKE